MLEVELKQLLIQIEGKESLGLIDERDQTILSAINIAKHLGYKAGFRVIGTHDGKIIRPASIPDWAGDVVAYIELPTGEVSYFMKKEELKYAGYLRETKLTRISNYLHDNYAKSESFQKETRHG